jgi:hypothetical protein
MALGNAEDGEKRKNMMRMASSGRQRKGEMDSDRPHKVGTSCQFQESNG